MARLLDPVPTGGERRLAGSEGSGTMYGNSLYGIIDLIVAAILVLLLRILGIF